MNHGLLQPPNTLTTRHSLPTALFHRQNHNNPPSLPPTGMATLIINVEYTGGLETLFSSRKTQSFTLPATSPSGSPATVADLISYLAADVVQQEKKELFVLGESVRPGILVLINDADWELEGEGAYELKDGDNIVFVSTLHGG
ncbi:hypothetical protein BDZ85DRAFT_257868 [Elsinoe ampelina]|uniref:Ubiquitin-related modifier 1 n=1 Tax=Elsinoe ampelina TaxID=302913 RepID=A0A6A6GJ23_9PEZI|nr:hypothetical protein BDZ85DRAFT_257868 [Elsinoe ampelina]